jgi:hypothetical protein
MTLFKLLKDPSVLLNLRMDAVGTKAEQRDILRASVSFLERFLEDLVKEVYFAALETLPQLMEFLNKYFPAPSDISYVLEKILPILMKRGAEGVHNLENQPTKTQLNKINDFIESTVALGSMEVIAKGGLTIHNCDISRSLIFYSKVSFRRTRSKVVFFRRDRFDFLPFCLYEKS